MSNNPITVLAAIIEKDGRILLCRRAPGRSNAGKWEFPGGKLEAGETEQECLTRELREELGVEADMGEFVAEFLEHDGRFLIKYYRVKLKSDDLKLSAHDGAEWVGREALLMYEMTHADRQMVLTPFAPERGAGGIRL